MATIPEGWTDDRAVPLPPGQTVNDVVESVIRSELSGASGFDTLTSSKSDGEFEVDTKASIVAAIQRLTDGDAAGSFADAARTYRALPLYEGWFAWALLTPEGEVLEAEDSQRITRVDEPLRTMFLVAGAERYPELKALLPVRPESAVACEVCGGTGWRSLEPGQEAHLRCWDCRALGWVASPS